MNVQQYGTVYRYIWPAISSSFVLFIFYSSFLPLPLLFHSYLSYISLPLFLTLTSSLSFSLPLLLLLSLSLIHRRTNEWICLYQSSKAFSTVTSMLVHNEKVYVTGTPQTKHISPTQSTNNYFLLSSFPFFLFSIFSLSLRLTLFSLITLYIRTCRLGGC
jgi:hypothetical protein